MADDVEYLGNDRRRASGPILNCTRTFYSTDTEPCVMTEFQGQEWYHGTGVRPEDHPGRSVLRILDQHLPGTECGFCQSKNVLVISLQGCVSWNSGDAYYDYEVKCQDCGKFSSFSYSEN